ncbi:MAG: cytochrome P450, partial [Acidobacteriaceae bacterium]|nr:cytochrome P450 [Acidobacteriaceae bacterium]
MRMCKQGAPQAAIDMQCELLSAPSIQNAYFDAGLNMWILTRYADVLAAFRSDALRPVGPRGTLEGKIDDEQDRLKLRAETTAALSPSALKRWQLGISCFASTLLSRLAAGCQADLVTQYARPLCEHAALIVTRPTSADTQKLLQLSAEVSAAAAEPFDVTLSARAKQCSAELLTHFSSGPLSLQESGFVALSQTLPCMLARCWLALLRHPKEWTRLHNQPALMEQAVDELLRYAGLAHILFRMAVADVNLNGIFVRKGERLMLKLTAANRDPERFGNAESLNFADTRKGHLALGFGKHACVGAPLIRMVICTATRRLVERFPSAAITGEIEWRGGAGF